MPCFDGIDEAFFTGGVLIDDAMGNEIWIFDGFLWDNPDGSRRMEFDIYVSPPNENEAVTVDWETNDDTAVAGVDYVANAGTLTIPAGESTGRITVQVAPALDQLLTVVKQFTVTLSNPANATIGVDTGIGMITYSRLPGLPGLPPIITDSGPGGGNDPGGDGYRISGGSDLIDDYANRPLPAFTWRRSSEISGYNGAPVGVFADASGIIVLQKHSPTYASYNDPYYWFDLEHNEEGPVHVQLRMKFGNGPIARNSPPNAVFPYATVECLILFAHNRDEIDFGTETGFSLSSPSGFGATAGKQSNLYGAIWYDGPGGAIVSEGFFASSGSTPIFTNFWNKWINIRVRFNENRSQVDVYLWTDDAPTVVQHMWMYLNPALGTHFDQIEAFGIQAFDFPTDVGSQTLPVNFEVVRIQTPEEAEGGLAATPPQSYTGAPWAGNAVYNVDAFFGRLDYRVDQGVLLIEGQSGSFIEFFLKDRTEVVQDDVGGYAHGQGEQGTVIKPRWHPQGWSSLHWPAYFRFRWHTDTTGDISVDFMPHTHQIDPGNSSATFNESEILLEADGTTGHVTLDGFDWGGSGAESSPGTTEDDIDLPPDVWIYVRASFGDEDPDEIRFRYWLEGDEDPVTWMLTAPFYTYKEEDANYGYYSDVDVTAENRLYIRFAISNAAASIEFDDLRSPIPNPQITVPGARNESQWISYPSNAAFVYDQFLLCATRNQATAHAVALVASIFDYLDTGARYVGFDAPALFVASGGTPCTNAQCGTKTCADWYTNRVLAEAVNTGVDRLVLAGSRQFTFWNMISVPPSFAATKPERLTELIHQIKIAIKFYGCAIVDSSWYNDWSQNGVNQAGSFILPLPVEANRTENHTYVLVGWTIVNNIKCFIVQNSGGRSWGKSGRAYLPFSYIDPDSKNGTVHPFFRFYRVVP